MSLDADISCCTQQGSQLFDKFLEQYAIPDVKRNLIKDAITVFVFLLGRIMEDLKRLTMDFSFDSSDVV